MDYVGLFRPVIAYSAHLRPAETRADCPRPDAAHITRDLGCLIDAAMEQRREPIDPNFDQAWFAVRAWLGGTLRSLDLEATARELAAAPDDAGSDFFRRLGLLLPRPGSSPHPDIRDILRVYALCMDLGYRGDYGDESREEQWNEYRRRCHDAVETGKGEVAEETEPNRNWTALAGKAAVWLVPILAPILLYGVFKFLLNNLYGHIMG